MPKNAQMATWFTSDWHLGHGNIIKYCNRPFADVDEMNEGLITRHNALVDPADTVYVLGDIAMSSRFLPLVSSFNGVKILIPGNHDAVFEGASFYSASAAQKYLDAGFSSIDSQPEPMTAGGVTVEISHFPYSEDHMDVARFTDWRLPDNGDWLFCGHIHTKWRQFGRQINVGVDAWAGSPVSLSALTELIEAGPADRAPLSWNACA